MNVYDNDYHDLFVEDIPLLTASDIDRIIAVHEINFNDDAAREKFVAMIAEKTIDTLNHTGVLEACLSSANDLAYEVAASIAERAAKNLPAKCVGCFFERPGFQGLDAKDVMTCVERIDASDLGIHPMSVEATKVESTAIGFVDTSVIQNDDLMHEVQRMLITVMNDMDAESENGCYRLANANAYITLDR